jgi:hypothetical protein
MICPDGSTVVRIQPNCDYAPCPVDNNNSNQVLRESEIIAMQQDFNEINMISLNGTDSEQYLESLVSLDWNESAFSQLMTNATNLVSPQLKSLNANRTNPVFLNFGIDDTQAEYAKTNVYYQNGSYGVIIILNLKRAPASKTAPEFWTRDYEYPINHEMRHIKRFFESGIFDKPRMSDTGSVQLYGEYLSQMYMDLNMPSEFNSLSTLDKLEELLVVLQTNNPIEVALNIDRLNKFPLSQLKYDAELSAEEIVPVYLEQIVLARHLKDVYSKPSIQDQNYEIRQSAFDEMIYWSTTFRNELYRSYPNDANSIQALESIYEEEAQKAIQQNTE